MSRRAAILAAFVAAALLASAAPARAGNWNIPCENPTLFDGATNVVHLPFQTVDATELDETARQLALLMQLESLFSIAPLRNVASIHLVGPCTPEQVLRRLEGARVNVVLVTGRFYKDAGQFYLQTTVRFYHRAAQERIEWRASRDGHDFRGHLPSQMVAFAARRVSLAELEVIRKDFESSARMRHAPSESDPGIKMVGPEEARYPTPFQVVEVRPDGWMRVRLMGGGGLRWVRAVQRRGPSTLRGLFPELAFVEAMVAFLDARQRELMPVHRRSLQSPDLGAALRATGDYFALAIVDVAIALLTRGAERESRLADAARRAPFSSATHNLRFLARLEALTEPLSRAAAQGAVQLLDEALTVNPDDEEALANLIAFYRWLRGRPSPPLPSSEIEGRLARLAVAAQRCNVLVISGRRTFAQDTVLTCDRVLFEDRAEVVVENGARLEIAAKLIAARGVAAINGAGKRGESGRPGEPAPQRAGWMTANEAQFHAIVGDVRRDPGHPMRGRPGGDGQDGGRGAVIVLRVPPQGKLALRVDGGSGGAPGLGGEGCLIRSTTRPLTAKFDGAPGRPGKPGAPGNITIGR